MMRDLASSNISHLNIPKTFPYSSVGAPATYQATECSEARSSWNVLLAPLASQARRMTFQGCRTQ
jgi:hypothetical protein